MIFFFTRYIGKEAYWCEIWKFTVFEWWHFFGCMIDGLIFCIFRTQIFDSQILFSLYISIFCLVYQLSMLPLPGPGDCTMPRKTNGTWSPMKLSVSHSSLMKRYIEYRPREVLEKMQNKMIEWVHQLIYASHYIQSSTLCI